LFWNELLFVFYFLEIVEKEEIVKKVIVETRIHEKPEEEEPEPKDLYEAYMYYKKTLNGVDFEKQSAAANIFYRFLGKDRDEVMKRPYFVDEDVIKRLVGLIRTSTPDKVRVIIFYLKIQYYI
jgi:hypothetical protein